MDNFKVKTGKIGLSFALYSIILLSVILFIPSVLAMDWDNIVEYKQEIPCIEKAEIYNSWIIPMVTKGDILASYCLMESKDSVLEGTASGEVAIYESRGVFDAMKFRNLKGEYANLKSKIYYNTTETREIIVPTYEEKCVEALNKTEICSQNKVSEKIVYETTEIMKEFNGEQLEIGTYKWRIDAIKEYPNQQIDWIANSYGKDLNEWAWWNTTFTKKAFITITGTVPLNYSIPIKINKTAEMDINYKAIRFTDNLETFELPYWIEWSNSTDALVWVKIQNNNGIYMYFANDTAVQSNANIKTAFWLGVDWRTEVNFTGSGFSQPVGTGTNTFSNKGLKHTSGIWTNDGITTTGIFNYSTLNADGIVFRNINLSFSVHSQHGFYTSTATDGNIGGKIIGITQGRQDMTMWTNGVSTGDYGVGTQTINYTSMMVMTGVPIIMRNVTTYNTDMKQIFNRLVNESTGSSEPLKLGFASHQTGYITTVITQVMPYMYIQPTYSIGSSSSSVDTTSINSIPATNSIITTSSITFGCNATSSGTTNINKVILNVTGISNFTQTINSLNTKSYNATFINTTLPEGVYSWNCKVFGNDGINVSSTDWTFTEHLLAPNITILYPTTTINYGYIGQNISLNYSITDLSIGSCWYNYGSGNVTISCIKNSSIILTSQKNITLYANDTVGNVINLTRSWDYNIFQNNVTYNASTSELSQELFNINLGGSVDYGYLVYNNTKYLLTNSGNNWYVNLQIPSGYSGNKSFFFEITSGSTTINTLTLYQYVNKITIQDCSLGGKAILNLTLKDEELNSLVNVTSPNTAKIEIDLYLSNFNNPNDYIHYYSLWDNNQTAKICIVNMSNSSYRIDFTIGYEGTDHVREFFFMDNGTLDNSGYFNSYTPNVINLMDLLTADSTTFLFSYTGANSLKVDNIIVHTFRKYIGEGLFREVERSKQDDNGQTHVHLVEEDVIYYFMITQFGNILFTSETYNAKCLSTPCEIELSASTTDINWTIIDNEGGNYAVSSDKSTRIVTTQFSINAIDLVNVSLYEFVNGEYSIINQTSVTSTAGSLSMNVPLAYGNKSFFVAVYRDNEFVKSEWIDLTDNGKDYFGTFGMILAGLLVLVIMLMAVSEGAGFIVFTILSLFIVSIMKLVDLNAVALISIACVGGIIIWKLTNRRNKQG